MARRTPRRAPLARGQRPLVISHESIEALLNGMLSSLPAAIGAAVDNRMQGRKLLREISKGQVENGGMLREISRKLDALGGKSSREHSRILGSLRRG